MFRILTRKYGLKTSDPHVLAVVRSFRDDPVKLRPPRYAKTEPIEHTLDPHLAEAAQSRRRRAP